MHAIPQWLRDRFDSIELDVRKLGAEGVFTQMRTKVQAYFEMSKSIDRSNAGKEMFLTGVGIIRVEIRDTYEWTRAEEAFQTHEIQIINVFGSLRSYAVVEVGHMPNMVGYAILSELRPITIQS